MADSSYIYNLKECSYDYSDSPCLKGVQLHLTPGKFYGLIGPNGSGKTTLINLLAGNCTPTHGIAELRSKPVIHYSKLELAKIMALVPQSFSLEFEYSVFELVMMGRHPYISRFSTPSETDINVVNSCLKQLDIEHLSHRYVTMLSGGERQRVLVARALAQQTPVLLLDEATASLDIRHSIEIMHAIRHRVVKQQVTVIGAIHDLDLAAAFCDEILVMHQGTIHTTGTVKETLTPELLFDIFGVDAEVMCQPDGSTHVQYRYNHE